MTRHDISEHDLAAATLRGRARAEKEFRARAVRYRQEVDAVEIITTRNFGFLIPRPWIEALSGVDTSDLSKLAVWPGGAAIELTDRDIHISVHGLLEGIMPRMMPESASVFGRRGGSATSLAKKASAKRNGAKGGRPRKPAVA